MLSTQRRDFRTSYRKRDWSSQNGVAEEWGFSERWRHNVGWAVQMFRRRYPSYVWNAWELHHIQRGIEVASLLISELYYDQHSRAWKCLWHHQLTQTSTNSWPQTAMTTNIYGPLTQTLLRFLNFWKSCKNHNLDRTANEFWDAEFESYLIPKNPCMVFITITTQGPQIWVFYHEHAITYLKNTWK